MERMMSKAQIKKRFKSEWMLLSNPKVAKNQIIALSDLAITKTIDEVIVYHSDGLHVGINDRRTNETESAMLEVPAECIRLG